MGSVMTRRFLSGEIIMLSSCRSLNFFIDFLMAAYSCGTTMPWNGGRIPASIRDKTLGALRRLAGVKKNWCRPRAVWTRLANTSRPAFFRGMSSSVTVTRQATARSCSGTVHAT